MKHTRALAVIAVVLFFLSVWVYRASVVQADRFERGQLLFSNLNPDDIAAIAITRGGDSVSLKRGKDRFEIASAHGYPAKNEAVNRLIRQILDIDLEKRVGGGEDLFEELAVVPGGAGTTEIELRNAADQPMVHFLVSTAGEDRQGAYVRRLDGDDDAVFLTSRGFSTGAGASAYLDKEIVDVKASEIATIEGRDFRVTDVGGKLTLDAVPFGRSQQATAMTRIGGALSLLSFDEVYLADDEKVRDLRFRQALQLTLKDGSGYRLQLAESGEDTYLKIGAFHTVRHVQVDREEGHDELQEKAKILSRAAEVSTFSEFHASWVYRISQATADKLTLRKSDLMEERG